MNLFSESRKSGKPLILDGAMGSLLQQYGYKSEGASWMTLINEKYPSKIVEIHKKYIEAGADIITTNTFRTNPAVFDDTEAANISKYVKNAVNLAVEAVGNSPVLIAGSNPPAEDCYQTERIISNTELKLNHYKHIDLLIDNRVDFILNETFSHIDEIILVCKYCSSRGIPYIISLYLDNDLRLLSGECLEEALSSIQEHNPVSIGINCISPEHYAKVFNLIDLNYNWGFYLNCGFDEYNAEEIKCRVSPKKYGDIVKEYLKYQPSFIGACCGSSPEHIKALKTLLD